MIITPRAETIRDLIFEASPPRSPGLHLSQIIKSICVELDPKRFKVDGLMDWNKIEAGFSFERVLETAFMARRDGIFRPGEITHDGVIMSPDGIDPEDWRLEEFKATWMSDFDAPHDPKFRHWLWQIQAYCLALGTRLARLRVLFMNGDYRAGYTPTYRVFDLEFTDEELQQNWAMLLHHARQKGML